MSVKKEKLEEKFFFMFNKNLNIPKSISITFLVLKNSTRFLILKNTLGIEKFIKIPSFIAINKNKQILNFKYTKELQTSKFFRIFFTIYQELKYKIFETIIIRGVGLKVTLLSEPSVFLELKLGYSHKILLTVPENLNVIVKKKKLLVEGSNKVLVGNFVNKIINFKSLNNYTGKGLWLKSYQKFILKEIKKI
jgi:hypothetical protein